MWSMSFDFAFTISGIVWVVAKLSMLWTYFLKEKVLALEDAIFQL